MAAVEAQNGSRLSNYEATLAISRIFQEKEQYAKEKQALKQRLMAIDYRMQQLDADYAKINNQSNRCPILRLPAEVTSTIFILAQGPAYSREKSVEWYEMAERLVEVDVSHVCRYWRSVALGNPNLWTRFKFDICHALVVPVKRFKAYMKRSAPKLVELYLNFNTYKHEDEGEHAFEVEDLLELLDTTMKYTERWKAFLLAMHQNVPLLCHPDKLQSALVPHLEYFAIISNHPRVDAKYPESLEPTIFTSGAPRLTSVIYDSSIGYGLLPPMQHITSFNLEDMGWERRSTRYIPWAMFLQILSLPCLADLSLTGALVETVKVSSNCLALELENLRFWRTQYFLPLLPFLIAPKLKTIVINSEDFEEWDTSIGPNDFPSLETLWLIGVSNMSRSGMEYLACFTRTIKHLTIVSEAFDEGFFEFLASRPGYWPNLKTVRMHIRGIEERLDEIAAFIASRPHLDIAVEVRKRVVQAWVAMRSKLPTLDRLTCQCRLKTIDDDAKIALPAIWKDGWEWDVDILTEDVQEDASADSSEED
ncbi:hypothetical protein CVT26_001029 [Gymnopilus dilepis]|uniref:Uncharacterized protein n=1 Tax=Gymnopilus dilepis TaxID=231916 RepID=A0A409X586_9AGAR|nr:hypothetical protein CVT26_001029 [Gymnopilus dilepis]